MDESIAVSLLTNSIRRQGPNNYSDTEARSLVKTTVLYWKHREDFWWQVLALGVSSSVAWGWMDVGLQHSRGRWQRDS